MQRGNIKICSRLIYKYSQNIAMNMEVMLCCIEVFLIECRIWKGSVALFGGIHSVRAQVLAIMTKSSLLSFECAQLGF